MLLLNLILLIEVTFSTPTPHYTNNRILNEIASFHQESTRLMEFMRGDLRIP